MKSNIEMESLERKIDQLVSRVEMLQRRLVDVENFQITLRKERQERNLKDEMWTKT